MGLFLNADRIRVVLPEVGDDFVCEFLKRITAEFRIGADIPSEMGQLLQLHGLRAAIFKTEPSRVNLDGEFIGE